MTGIQPSPTPVHDPTRQPGVQIAHILVEQATFSHRQDYLSENASTTVTFDELEINLEAGMTPDERHGVIRLKIRPKPDQPKALYDFDVTIVGLVLIDPARPNMLLPQYFATSGAALLYPFARELIANLTSRGRFGPIWLTPLNISVTKIEPTTAKGAVSAPKGAQAGAITR